MLHEIDLAGRLKAETIPHCSQTLWVKYVDVKPEHLENIIAICVSGFGLDKKPRFSTFSLESFKDILNPPHMIEWRPNSKRGYSGNGLDIVRLEGEKNQLFVRFKAVGRLGMNADMPDPREVNAQKKIDSYLLEKFSGRKFALEQVVAHEVFVIPPVHVEDGLTRKSRIKYPILV
jgi:hypothetical protein